MSTTEHDELPRQRAHALADPAGRITALAGALLVGPRSRCAIPARDRAAGAAGAGTVLALFVLVPRGLARRAGIRRCWSARCSPRCRSSLIVFFGFFADGRALWALPELVFALLPLAIIALAALGGLILIADDLRTRFGLAQPGLTPWQRLTGTADAPGRRPGGRSVDLRWLAWPRSSRSATRRRWQRGPLVPGLLLVLAAARGVIAVAAADRGPGPLGPRARDRRA